MGLLISFLLLYATSLMIPGGYAWCIEPKRQRNTYRIVMSSCALYALASLLLIFFPYKPQPLIVLFSVGLFSLSMAAATFFVWKKYQEAYPKEKSSA